MAGVGHNSGDASTQPDVLNKTAQGQLKSIIERIENLTDNDLHDAKEAIKEVYAEAKCNGFDVKIIRKIVRLHGMDRAKRQEEQAMIDLYSHAIGLDLV